MTFDPGEVLSRAWQITWKHRGLWVFSMLPWLPFAVVFPLLMYLFLAPGTGVPLSFEDPNLWIVLTIGTLFLTALSAALQVFSHSGLAYGLYQAETGAGTLALPQVAQGARTFFPRILGVVVLIGIGTMAFFTVFSACLSIIGLVTFGIGSALGQLFSLPAAMAAYALMEQAQAAVVADALRPTDAVSRAWGLLKEHVHVYALETVILYFGLSLFSGIAALPVIAPLFIAVSGRFAGQTPNPSTWWTGMLCFGAVLPIYLLAQAIATLYMKATYMLTYLRLTRSAHLQPLSRFPEAAS